MDKSQLLAMMGPIGVMFQTKKIWLQPQFYSGVTMLAPLVHFEKGLNRRKEKEKLVPTKNPKVTSEELCPTVILH